MKRKRFTGAVGLWTPKEVAAFGRKLAMEVPVSEGQSLEQWVEEVLKSPKALCTGMLAATKGENVQQRFCMALEEVFKDKGGDLSIETEVIVPDDENAPVEYSVGG